MAQEWREILKEDIVLPSGKVLTLGRARTSKAKRLYVDGKPTYRFSCDATIAPMHYKDAGDEWQDIRAELLPSTQSIVGFGNPAFEMVENEYEMFVLGTLNSGVPLVRYVSKNTEYWVQFAAHNLQWTNDLDQIDLIATPASTPTEVSVSESKWPDVYGAGLDLRFVAGLGRMGKWLDIASALPSPPQFIIDGGNPVIEFAEILEFHNDLEVWVNGAKWNKSSDISTVAEIEFRSPDGEVQFVFPVATGFDESELGEPVVGQLHLKKQGPNLYVTVRFPWSWLQSATYPVHLDVTVDKDVAAGADDGGRYSGTRVFDATGTDTYIGWSNSPIFYVSDGFLRWIGVTIEGTIDVSYTQLYASYGAGAPQMKVRGVDQDNPDAPTSQAEFDADPLTDAGVDWDELCQPDGWFDSPSLNTIFQELVDTYTISNDAVMLQILDDGSKTNGLIQANVFYLYERVPVGTYGPKLHIEYTAGGASYSIVVDAGSYAVTGAAAALPIGRVMGAAAGSYAVAGAAVSLLRDLLIGAGAGSYALSGNAVSLPVDRVIGAGAGSYSLTGATVALLKDVLISAGAGSYAISGTAASLLLDWVLSADAGAYAITGADADLLRALIMAAAGGTYTLTGADVAFLRGKIMTAEAGLYVLTGSDVDLLKAMIIAAAGGTYTIAGQESSLRVTIGAVLEPIIGVLRAIDVVEGMLVEKDKTRSGLSTGRPKAVID